MKVVLVRHLAVSVPPGVCYGRLDLAPHPDSLAAMTSPAGDPAFRGMVRVWSSPARRCRILAEAIAFGLGLSPTIDDRLQELDFGDWEGMAWSDIDRVLLDRWAAEPEDFCAPNGEPVAALVARARDFYGAICERGQDCIVVSHGGPLKILTALLRSDPIDLLAPAPGLGSIMSFIAPESSQ